MAILQQIEGKTYSYRV